MRNPILLLSLILGSILGACTPRVTPPGPETASGVYIAHGYEYFRWQEGLRLMIWHDDPEFTGCSSSSSTSDPEFVLTCQAKSRQGVEFEWRLETQDGVSAEFFMDGEGFDLGQGAVFLVRTSSGGAEISQLARDLSEVPARAEAVVQFALNDPAILAFLGRSALP